MSDHAEVRDLVAAYCRGVDRLDLDLVRSVYAPDGIDHHTGFDGTADEYVAWLGRSLPVLGGTMHTLGQTLVEVHGDVAVAETYGTATHWGTPSNEPALNFTTGFRYVDRLARHPVGGGTRWLVAERWAVREWMRLDAGPTAGSRVSSGAGPAGPQGSRGPDDPLTRLLSAVREQSGRPQADIVIPD